jgi:UDP:flavonoid glycosyltransferase YjiC (YdhE family)
MTETRADLLFVTWDGGGNVPPALGIADELARRGHRTRFIGHAGQEADMTGRGHGFTAYGEAADFVGSARNSPIRMVRLFSDRAMGRDVLAELERRPADVVVVDALLMGALDVLAEAGARYVPLQHLFVGYQRGPWLRSPMGTWARVRRMRPRARWDAPELSLAATLADLDPGAGPGCPANLRFTGPVVEAPQRRATFGDRAVLVSLSTFAYPGMQAALQRVVDATEGLDARVVVTTGPALDPAGLRVHGGVEVHRYVPHDQLMPDVSLVVGHGGHATAMRALAHDLPVLTLPMHRLLDQPMVGRAIERAGAGRAVKKSTSPEHLRPVLAELLEPGPHREAAARLGAAIREAHGASTAATLLEDLVSQQPTRPSEAPTTDRRAARP